MYKDALCMTIMAKGKEKAIEEQSSRILLKFCWY